ncbi:hypothetical protein [Apilactobacillus timberlakei]|uniref:hypothetical protein n=1 Tax=Apilactobacillus timberlakei TaxID=2008380 RepID=UPI0011287641|nr:hypothetical protein [Apilactobacillus timberlakei]TPR12237.1 hypothetical protein DYZ97_07085 [Apilactobacillus timberlakei]
MAKDLLYTTDGDLYMGPNGPVEVSGLDEIKQTLDFILMTMDTSWLIGGYDENAAISTVNLALKQDKRVIDVIKVSSSYDNENHTVDFYIIVNTTLGTLDFRKELRADAIN